MLYKTVHLQVYHFELHLLVYTSDAHTQVSRHSGPEVVTTKLPSDGVYCSTMQIQLGIRNPTILQQHTQLQISQLYYRPRAQPLSVCTTVDLLHKCSLSIHYTQCCQLKICQTVAQAVYKTAAYELQVAQFPISPLKLHQQ